MVYSPKTSHYDPSKLFPRLEKNNAVEFLAWVITQIPEPSRQWLFYYGNYANAVEDAGGFLDPLTRPCLLETSDLSGWIRRIEAGERISITAHGRVVAELVPPGTTPRTGRHRLLRRAVVRGDDDRLPRLLTNLHEYP